MTGHVIKPDVNELYPVLTRAEGIYVYDDQGRRYLDAAAGVGVTALGYGMRRREEALRNQAAALPFAHGMRFGNPAAQQLADKLAAFAPSGLSWSFFASGGSEAIESALKTTDVDEVMGNEYYGHEPDMRGTLKLQAIRKRHLRMSARRAPWNRVPLSLSRTVSSLHRILLLYM